MWRTDRVGGKKKLLNNAVPTLFWQYVKNPSVSPGGIEKVLVDIERGTMDDSIDEVQNVRMLRILLTRTRN